MLPYFFQETLPPSFDQLTLDEPTSKHCIQVLRMTAGMSILLTDGKGGCAEVQISAPDRKKCTVRLVTRKQEQPRLSKLSMGIAFTKNKNRNEWFLEKATELGIEYIFPLVTERSERERFNMERNNQVLIAALLQSKQCFLPVLHAPQKLNQFLKSMPDRTQRFIAHCGDSEDRSSLIRRFKPDESSLILIGPEGDFSPKEVDSCIQSGFIPVTLGPNRLRTETAGLYACTVFNAFHYG